ncbi:MAG: PD-(D/E)XK nuclease family protein [Candidatus Limnocylindrales bacterium]
MLSVLGRQRDELSHSRLIGWLLMPTGQHGLGRGFLRAFLDAVWPGEAFMASGAVTVEIETAASARDEDGQLRGARADIVVRGNDVTVVIENKLDAGEQPDQCERLYWSWAADPGETRWLFLTPTGRTPVTVTSTAARAAWRTLSYAQLHTVMTAVLDQSPPSAAAGRPTVLQYLATLSGAIAR